MADDEYEDLGRESRFAHLLRPILRDLAENWNVDLAQDLEEYVEHLNRTSFAFGADGDMLDFAEAALLIQSSACVYSKKVEYLHTLVFQALDVVRSKHRQGAAEDGESGAPSQAAQGGRGRHAATAAMEADESIEAFLQAGEDMKECDDIDLEEDDEQNSQMSTFTRPPAALLTLDDQTTGGGDGDAGLYRVAACAVHLSGALLLDARDGEHHDAQLRWVLPHPPGHIAHLALVLGSSGATAGQAASDQPPQLAAEGTAAVGAGADSDDDGAGGYAAGDCGNDDDCMPDSGVEGGDRDDELAGCSLPAGHSGEPATADGGMLTAAASLPLQTIAGPLHSHPAAPAGDLAVDQDEREFYDPYEPLDLDAPGNLPIKPMVVRRPPKGRLLSGWQQAGSVHASSSRSSATIAAAAARGIHLVHSEFAYALPLLLSASQRPGKQPRTSRQLATAAQRISVAQQPAAVFELRDVIAAREADQAAWQEDEKAVPFAAANQHSDDDCGVPDDHWGDGAGAQDLLDAMAGGRLERYGPSGDGGAGGGVVSGMMGDDGEAQSYEDLCRSHMDSIIAAAAAQEVQTELSQRVSGWRQRIDPVLKLEESRTAFDIQEYGQKIVVRLSQLGPAQPAAGGRSHGAVGQRGNFQEVTVGLEKYEVSRLFSAMLQLINNRNVLLSASAVGPEAPFQLTLLDAQLPHHLMAARLGAASGAVADDNTTCAAPGATALQAADALDALQGPERDENADCQDVQKQDCTKAAPKRQRNAKNSAVV